MAETAKPRKPKARATAIVLGGLEENIWMLGKTGDAETIAEIGARMAELADELKRSLKKNGDDSDE